MKAITLTQPWATLVAIGAKTWETRSWSTSHRGPIAIHASKRMTGHDRDFMMSSQCHNTLAGYFGDITRHDENVPQGAVIAIANLDDCRSMHPQRSRALLADWVQDLDMDERAFGNYSPERYGFHLANVYQLAPIPTRGMLGIWNWDPPKEFVDQLASWYAGHGTEYP